MNYYSHHIGDYRRDTAHLSLLEHGVYRQLLDFYYLNESPITTDLTKLMRSLCVRTSEEEQALCNVLADFFVLTENGYIQGRCDTNIAAYHAKSEKASQSAKARWTGVAKQSDADAMRSHTEGNANHKPITNNHKPILKTITPPLGVDEIVWNDFVAHRKSKKAPISATALKGIEVEARKANISLQAALEMCCSRGWTGFKAEWLADKSTAMQSRQEKNMEGLHQLTGGMLRPKKDYSVFPSIVMEAQDVQLLGN